MANLFVSNRIWDPEDELYLLKGMVQYKARTALNPTKYFDGFLSFLGGSIVTKFTRKQISGKISKLKRKFNVRFSKISSQESEEEEEYPNLKFANSIDARIFHYSKLFWGPNNRTHSPLPHLNIVISDDDDEEEHATDVDNNEQQSNEEEEEKEEEKAEEEDNVEETHTDDEHMADAAIDNEQHGEEEDGEETEANNTQHEANDTNDSAEELCYLKDAVETMLSRGLTDHQKKLQVDNIVKLGAEKRRELSCEWKALCGEEAKLIMNKFKLAAKIAKAIDDKF
ncbi:unnamed protein product [Cochlearia groenlandica]